MERSAAVRNAGSTLAAPDSATVAAMRKVGFKFHWMDVPGAAAFTAQRASVPAAGAEPVWELLEGSGISRKMLDLVPGQSYLFRVCAVGSDTRASGWSATVTFTAPPNKKG